MKKNYIGIVALAICSTGFSQNGVADTQPLFEKADKGSVIEATTPLTEKGITLWSNDCSNPSDWVFAHTTGATYHTVDWYQETAPATPAGLGDFASTTVGNGFLMINSDANNSADADGTIIEATATIAVPIDLSATGGTGQAENDVVLEFQHQFRWWQDIRQVRVSGDNGSTWTTFEVSDATGNLVGAAAQNTENPEITTFNISSVAGGSSQVLVQFYYNDQDYWGWYWMVDDIKIKRQDPNDLVSVASYFGSNGFPYFSVPTTQVAPVDFYQIASNVGSVDQTSTITTVDVNSGTFTGTSAGKTIVSGTSDTLFVTTQYTPAATVGTHTISYDITSSATDITPADNMDSDAFDIVAADNQYGRDRGVYGGQAGGEDNATPGDFAFEAGSVMQIFADQQAFGIDVVIGSNTPAGTIIYGKLYTDDGAGGFAYVDETAEYTTTAADATNNATITLTFFTAPTLSATQGWYYPMVGCYSEFYYGTSGTSEDQTSFIMYPTAGGSGSQYYTNNTPMVRLNFGYNIGISENATGNMELGQNMPNPFNNTTTINYSVNNNSKVTLTVVDMAGKVVKTINEGTKPAGDYTITLDGSDLAEGMYYYTLSNGETSITKNMTIIK